MGCDMMVVPGWAAVDGHTLFGHNSARPTGERQVLHRSSGRCHVSDEKARTAHAELPEAHQTYTVLGCQPENEWGYSHGVNEYGVAAGYSQIKTKLCGDESGLSAGELVRLVLERSRTACRAVEILTDFITRYGQCNAAGELGGHSFLVADPTESFIVESGGKHWAVKQVTTSQAVSETCLIRQDWDRIAPGLADHVLAARWWPDDGSKLDFAASVSPVDSEAPVCRRWRHYVNVLIQQQSRIDLAFLRRLLGDHFEGCEEEFADLSCAPLPVCQHPTPKHPTSTAVSFVVRLQAPSDRLFLAWWAFGPPCVSPYLPIFLDAELPDPLAGRGTCPPGEAISQRMGQVIASLGLAPARWKVAQEVFGRLQTQLDQKAEEFALENAHLKQEKDSVELERQIHHFMEHVLEMFDATVSSLRLPEPGPTKAATFR